jgi:2-C-methyl-D-erythritol 4-phosphate cytidylyltransferase
MGDVKFAVILPAAGKSSRFGGKEKKPFLTLDGRAVWLRAAEAFATRDDVAQMIIAIADEDRERFALRFAANTTFLNIHVVSGGAERFDSIRNALAVLKPEINYVAIHDAVRPGISTKLIDQVFGAAIKTGAALPGVPVSDTLKRVKANDLVEETIDRKALWLAQTPQTFRRDWIEAAYANLDPQNRSITDDAQLIEALGHPVAMIRGEMRNLKITTQDDLYLAELLAKHRPNEGGAARYLNPFDESWMK